LKFVIQQKQLLTALSICSKAVNQNNIIPILGSFLITGKKGGLLIHASDQENYLSFSLECENDNDFLIAIPAKITMDILNELSEQPLNITLADDTFIINSFTGVYKIPYDDGAMFPVIKHNSEFELELNTEAFLSVLNKSAFACAQGHSVLAFNSLLVELEKNRLTAVGCDGWVMGVQSMDIISDNEMQFLITPKSIGMLTQIPYNETFKLSLSKTSARFIFNDDTVFICLLTDEKYPNYKGVLPKENDKFLTVDRAQLLGSMKRLKIFSNERSDDCNISTGEKTTMKSKNLKSEEADETIIGSVVGESIDIKLKCSLVIQCLLRIPDNMVTLSFKTQKSAVLIETENKNGLMMVMPVF
jgi:DNA polymerase-3 subunit beta